ncbi:18881_t:CDS:1, partial [Gigaspora rosea]
MSNIIGCFALRTKTHVEKEDLERISKLEYTDYMKRNIRGQ